MIRLFWMVYYMFNEPKTEHEVSIMQQRVNNNNFVMYKEDKHVVDLSVFPRGK